MPRTGLPELLASWGEWQALLAMLQQTFGLDDASKIWWDIRPSGANPTLEVRVCDVCTDLEHALSLVALYQSLLALAMGTVIVLYVLLGIVFVGALSPGQLANGWGSLSDNTGAGPFASMALALGLGWLATLLFADAAISPGGTALIYTGVAGRLSLAAARNGHAPPPVGRLNRAGVPAVAIWINFLIGLSLLLPFPGWQKMMTLISSTLVLSLAFGPVCLLALRAQAPHLPRRYRLPAAPLVAGLAAVLASFVVYWAGWQVNSLLMLVAFAGWITLPVAVRLFARRSLRRQDLQALLWLAPYFGGLALISWLGHYGGGRGLIPPGIDLVLLALVAIGALALSYRLRLPADETRLAIDAALAEHR
jgi:amino acid transporter